MGSSILWVLGSESHAEKPENMKLNPVYPAFNCIARPNKAGLIGIVSENALGHATVVSSMCAGTRNTIVSILLLQPAGLKSIA